MLAGCPAEDGPRCPEQFKVGEPCEVEEQVCPYPAATCENAPECVCANQPGGLYWECNKLPYCRCTCFCGKIAINTCEGLGCVAEASDPCPAKAAPICAVICQDAGLPDSGPDLPVPDLGPVDGHPDQLPPDLSRDLSPDLDFGPGDLPIPDLSAPDASVDGATAPEAGSAGG